MMSDSPHIITDSNDTKCAIFEKGRLVDYFIKSSGEETLGQLAYVRITQLFPAHHRAEITLPDGTNASMRLSPKQPYKVGDIIPVTVTAMPRQHKPWQVELGFQRVGRLVMLHYGGADVRLSKKAADPASLTPDAKSIIQAALPEGWGAVIKRGCEALNPDDIIAEIQSLMAPLPKIAEFNGTEPALIYGGDDVRFQAGLALNGPTQIRVNDETALWDDIDQMAANALALPYEMTNGARLFCEATQACTVFDVDSGASGLSPSALAEIALEEVLWLIRLASLSGVILIDVPRLPYKAQQALLAKLSPIALRDRRHPEILGFSRAGLLEITVRHGRAPLTVRHPAL